MDSTANFKDPGLFFMTRLQRKADSTAYLFNTVNIVTLFYDKGVRRRVTATYTSLEATLTYSEVQKKGDCPAYTFATVQ